MRCVNRQSRALPAAIQTAGHSLAYTQLPADVSASADKTTLWNVFGANVLIGVVVTDSASGSKIPAGWYPDPDDETLNRWWNGLGWTEHRSSLAEVTAQADAAAERLATAAAGLDSAKDAAVDEFRAAAAKLTNESRSLVNGATSGSSGIGSPSRTASSGTSSIGIASNSTGSAGFGTTTYSSTSAPRTSATAPRASGGGHDFARSRTPHRVPEITQPKNTFGKSLAAFSFIAIVAGLGLIVGLLVN